MRNGYPAWPCGFISTKQRLYSTCKSGRYDVLQSTWPVLVMQRTTISQGKAILVHATSGLPQAARSENRAMATVWPPNETTYVDIPMIISLEPSWPLRAHRLIAGR